jgi:predicted 3-demethylubiquinone-9 3-methyltransferase (glyoxalase superfamily)
MKILKGQNMQRNTPFLWFDSNAEEAVQFYTSIFKDSKITGITRYGAAAAETSGRPEGTVMTVAFELEGQRFVAQTAVRYSLSRQPYRLS